MPEFKSPLLKHIQYDNENSWWKDTNTGECGLVPGWYLFRVLGFCGCGQPEAALEFVRDALRMVEAHHNDYCDNDYAYGSEGWDSRSKRHEAETVALFGPNRGARYFVWYWLDDKGYTEHGGSVPGWLTEKGRDLLLAIDEVLALETERCQNE